jgi:hypothetical protein|nr:MAG TPA: hypothetical protein [Caudoviricetes sp.]
MSKINRQEIALAIAKELRDITPLPRISDHTGVTTIECSPGKIEITDNGVFVKTRRGVSTGWTHGESDGPKHSAVRCSILLRSVS